MPAWSFHIKLATEISNTLNLNKGLFGNILIGTFNLVNKLINDINQFIGNYIIM